MIATASRGTGPAVVWIHGYTMDSSLWEPLWDLLPGWRHVGVNLPGHGASDPFPGKVTLPDVAAMVADAVRENEATRLVALSFGSMIAVQSVLDHPGLVDRLVLAAPTLAGAAADPQARRRYQELSTLYRLTGPGEHLADLWMTSPPDIFKGTEKHPDTRARIRDTVLRHAWTELADATMQRLTIGRHDAENLSAIRARTLVLIGDEDMPAFTANAELLTSVVEDCRSVTVAGAGHLPLLELPHVTAPLIAAHLHSEGDRP